MNSLVNNYKVATAIQQGTSHIKNRNIPCQDVVLVKSTDDIIFLGLADGAGSKLQSQDGAKHILDALLVELTTNLNFYLESDDIRSNLTNFIETSLHLYASDNDITFEQLDSTLLVVLIYNGKYLLLHIGDGLIVSIDLNKDLQILSLPENGEYANETFFTTTCSYKQRLRILQGYSKDISNGLLLCSDGIEDLIYNYQTLQVTPIVKTIIEWLDAESEDHVSQILSHNLKNNFSKRSDDDLSIIIYKEIEDESI